MTQTPNRPKITNMSDSGTNIGLQTSHQPKPKILQGIYDLPIRTKQLIGLCIAQLVTLFEAISQATVEQSKSSEVVTDTITDVAVIAVKTSTDTNKVSKAFNDL
jgi:hypothetical protein